MGQYLLILGIVWLFDILTVLAAYSDETTTHWDSLQLTVATTITFVGFATLTLAQRSHTDMQVWIHLVLAAVNLVIAGVLAQTGGSLRAAALVAVGLVAVDSFATVRLSTADRARTT